MRYEAKKVKKEFEVTGIKEMELLDGTKTEVVFAKKMYDKKKLEDTLNAYREELNTMIESYNVNIADMVAIVNAIDAAEKCK